MTKSGETRDVAPAEFIEGMGQLFEADGFARISGRILGCLMLSAEPRSLQELADALQVSRASVSNNTRLLERLGALARVTVPGDRRDYYQMSDDVQDRMLEMRMAHFAKTRELLSLGLRTPAARDARVRNRMVQFSSFFCQMEEAMTQSRAKWERMGRGQRGSAQRKSGQ
ncbi:MAG TPA: MarR family transcriptional regulator [Longimicrobiales bacterium]|nr:MarR family transcriptional regulator [Longimicrobiales bacterium]